MRTKGNCFSRFIALCFFPFVLLTSCEEINLPPTASFKVSAYLADTLSVLEFNASACTDQEDDVFALLVRWDFEGDGQWDTEYSATKVTAFRYDQQRFNYPVLEVRDQDKAITQISDTILITDVVKVSQMTDPRDGKTYKITLIDSIWWMSENLDYGKWIVAPAVQEDNEIVEKYYHNNDSAQPEYQGGLYTWKEAIGHSKDNLPQGICPDGWQIPGQEAVTKLLYKAVNEGGGDLLFAKGGFWNLDLGPTGAYGLLYDYSFIKSYGLQNSGYWWTEEFFEYSPEYMFHYMEYDAFLRVNYFNHIREKPNHFAIPIRCVKRI